MIKANELRIGNYIKRGKSNYWPEEYKGEIVKVDYIDIASIGFMDRYEPIPLTPEVFEKSGFICVDAPYQKRFEKIYAESDEKKYWIGFYKDINGDWYTTNNVRIHDFKIHYLHQLQNLYFTLVGEELEINL